MEDQTLMDLELSAKEELKKEADEWVRALAKHECVGYDELRPYLVSFQCSSRTAELVFDILGHSSIKAISHVPYPGSDIDERLKKCCSWYVPREGDDSIHCKSLGHALLVSRWVHDKGKWLRNLL